MSGGGGGPWLRGGCRGARGPCRPGPRWRRRRPGVEGGDDLLDGVDGHGPDLDLLGRTVLEELVGLDAGQERVVVAEYAGEAEDVGDEVVGEHGQAIEVVEAPGALAAEGLGQVDGGDLGPLEQRDPLTVVLAHVPVQLVLPGQQLDQIGRRTARRRPPGRGPSRTASMTSPIRFHDWANRSMRSLTASSGPGRRPRRTRPRSADLHLGDRHPAPVPEGAGNRVVAGGARRLAQHGEPAGAEVDGVEGEDEAGPVLVGRSHGVVGRVRRIGAEALGGQIGGQDGNGVGDEMDMVGAGRDPRSRPLGCPPAPPIGYGSMSHPAEALFDRRPLGLHGPCRRVGLPAGAHLRLRPRSRRRPREPLDGGRLLPLRPGRQGPRAPGQQQPAHAV